MKDIKQTNQAKTLDEIINEARLDYLTGNYTSHKTTRGLIAELES